jgi:hypothetical protein
MCTDRRQQQRNVAVVCLIFNLFRNVSEIKITTSTRYLSSDSLSLTPAIITRKLPIIRSSECKFSESFSAKARWLCAWIRNRENVKFAVSLGYHCAFTELHSMNLTRVDNSSTLRAR